MDYRFVEIAKDVKEAVTSGMIAGKNGELTYWELKIKTFSKAKEVKGSKDARFTARK